MIRIIWAVVTLADIKYVNRSAEVALQASTRSSKMSTFFVKLNRHIDQKGANVVHPETPPAPAPLHAR